MVKPTPAGAMKPFTDTSGPAIAAAIAANDTVAFYEHYSKALQHIETVEDLEARFHALLQGSVVDFIDRHSRTLSQLADIWSQALLRSAFRSGRIRIMLEYLALPPLFQGWRWRTTRAGEWQALKTELAEATNSPRLGDEQRLHALIAMLVIDGLNRSLEEALTGFFSAAATIRSASAAAVGGWLERTGWYYDLEESLPAGLAENLAWPVTVPRDHLSHPLALLDLLGFFKSADKQWTAALFTDTALPWLRQALDRQDYGLALALENRVYNEYVKQTETEAHFKACIGQWLAPMLEAGRRVRATLGEPEWPLHEGPPVIGFLLFSAHVLAHTEVLLSVLKALSELDSRPFSPRIYVFGGSNPELARQCGVLGVPLTFLGEACGEQAKERFQRLRCLRELLRRDQVTALAYVGQPIMMPFAFAMGMAPVQIWWSVRYHSLAFDEIDGYLTPGAPGETLREIGGQTWRVAPGTVHDLYEPRHAEAARTIRAKYAQHSVLLGSLARPEKLDNEAFIGMLASILKANPQAAFFWFGKAPLPGVQELMREHGIEERCYFQGWVDTRLFAQVLDIHLDTFPFPAGLTMYQTMAAGVPGVSMLTEAARQNGAPSQVLPILRGEAGGPEAQRRVREIFAGHGGESLFPCADDETGYVALVQRLIDDTALRSRVGDAARRFVDAVNDPRQSARAHARHLLEIIDEKRKRSTGALQ